MREIYIELNIVEKEANWLVQIMQQTDEKIWVKENHLQGDKGTVEAIAMVWV